MQLSRKEIIDKLKEILKTADDRKTVNLDNVTEDSKLFTDLGFTSVNMLYMVIAIEETFNIEFEDAGVDDFVTIKDVVDFIEEGIK